MSDEPLYQYVKGQGWVVKTQMRDPNVRPQDHEEICNTCGERWGEHMGFWCNYEHTRRWS